MCSYLVLYMNLASERTGHLAPPPRSTPAFTTLRRFPIHWSSNISRRIILMERRPCDISDNYAVVSSNLALFKDLFYLPLAGKRGRRG